MSPISDRIGAYTGGSRKPLPPDPGTPDFFAYRDPESWLVEPVTSRAAAWTVENLWPGEYGEREFRLNRLIVPFGRIFDTMDEIFDAGFRVI